MDIHGKSVDMDMNMDGEFHIHGKPEFIPCVNRNFFSCGKAKILTRQKSKLLTQVR